MTKTRRLKPGRKKMKKERVSQENINTKRKQDQHHFVVRGLRRIGRNNGFDILHGGRAEISKIVSAHANNSYQLQQLLVYKEQGKEDYRLLSSKPTLYQGKLSFALVFGDGFFQFLQFLHIVVKTEWTSRSLVASSAMFMTQLVQRLHPPKLYSHTFAPRKDCT